MSRQETIHSRSKTVDVFGVSSKPVPLEEWQQSANEPYEQVDTKELASSLSDNQRKAVRLLLINNPGLLQDDIALELSIPRFALERCKTKPEDTPLKEDQCALLASNGLGKVILDRRNARQKASQEIEEAKAEQLRERLKQSRLARIAKEQAEKEARRKAALKKGAKTKKKNINALYRAAQKRGEHKRRSTEEKIQTIEEKRASNISQLAIERKNRLKTLGCFLTPREILGLSVINKDYKTGAELTGMNIHYLRQQAADLKRRFGLETKEDLAIWALDHGMSYELPEPQEISTFSLRERQVSAELRYENSDIAEILGIPLRRVQRDVEKLLIKTGAANRAEIALIAETYCFRPFPEELEKTYHEALESFTEKEREAISRLHLPSPVIAKELGVSDSNVAHLIQSAVKRSGSAGYMDLALKLHEQGFKFDIKKPKGQIHEILTHANLPVARCAELSNPEIAEKLNISKDHAISMVSASRARLGARGRIELVLMMKEYDTGEEKQQDSRTRPEKFFDAIGLPPMNKEDTEKILAITNETERKCIEAYYFSDNEPSWGDVSKTVYIRRTSATNAGKRGIERIRAAIEAEKNRRTNPDQPKERELLFFKKLGIEPLSTDEREKLLESLYPKTADYIREYFFSGHKYEWKDVGLKLGVTGDSARIAARKAINAIREDISNTQSANEDKH